MRSDAPPSPLGDAFRALLAEMPRYATLPAYGPGGSGSAVRFDADGRLWVAEYQIEFGAARRSWQAFDRDGVFLGRLDLPDGFIVMEFGRDWVLGALRDEMEVERVVLYGLNAPATPSAP
jgi:hypothetical protein